MAGGSQATDLLSSKYSGAPGQPISPGGQQLLTPAPGTPTGGAAGGATPPWMQGLQLGQQLAQMGQRPQMPQMPGRPMMPQGPPQGMPSGVVPGSQGAGPSGMAPPMQGQPMPGAAMQPPPGSQPGAANPQMLQQMMMAMRARGLM